MLMTCKYYSKYNPEYKQYVLLHSENHYDSITEIKAFLNVEELCYSCKTCFKHSDAFKLHDCCMTKPDIAHERMPRNHTLFKDAAHYMRRDIFKRL